MSDEKFALIILAILLAIIVISYFLYRRLNFETRTNIWAGIIFCSIFGFFIYFYFSMYVDYRNEQALFNEYKLDADIAEQERIKLIEYSCPSMNGNYEEWVSNKENKEAMCVWYTGKGSEGLPNYKVTTWSKRNFNHCTRFYILWMGFRAKKVSFRLIN